MNENNNWFLIDSQELSSGNLQLFSSETSPKNKLLFTHYKSREKVELLSGTVLYDLICELYKNNLMKSEIIEKLNGELKKID